MICEKVRDISVWLMKFLCITSLNDYGDAEAAAA